MKTFSEELLKKVEIPLDRFYILTINGLEKKLKPANLPPTGVMLKRAWMSIEITPERYLLDLVKLEEDVPHFLITLKGHIIQFIGIDKRLEGTERNPLPKNFFLRIDLEGPRYYYDNQTTPIQYDLLEKLLKCIRYAFPTITFTENFIQEYYWDYFCNGRDEGIYDRNLTSDQIKDKVILKIGNTNICYKDLVGKQVVDAERERFEVRTSRLKELLENVTWKRMIVNIAVNSIISLRFLFENAEIEEVTKVKKGMEEVEEKKRVKMSDYFKYFSSVARPPIANYKEGGVYNSQHITGEAADVQFKYDSLKNISQKSFYTSLMRFLSSTYAGQKLYVYQLIYETTKEDFDKVLYTFNLWVHIGLSRRISIEEHEEVTKLRAELKKEIEEKVEEEFKKKIEGKNLTEEQKENIKENIKKKIEKKFSKEHKEKIEKKIKELTRSFEEKYEVVNTADSVIVKYGNTVLTIPLNVIESPTQRAKIHRNVFMGDLEPFDGEVISDRPANNSLLFFLDKHLSKKSKSLFSSINLPKLADARFIAIFKKGGGVSLESLGIALDKDFYKEYKGPEKHLAEFVKENKEKNEEIAKAIENKPGAKPVSVAEDSKKAESKKEEPLEEEPKKEETKQEEPKVVADTTPQPTGNEKLALAQAPQPVAVEEQVAKMEEFSQKNPPQATNETPPPQVEVKEDRPPVVEPIPIGDQVQPTQPTSPLEEKKEEGTLISDIDIKTDFKLKLLYIKLDEVGETGKPKETKAKIGLLIYDFFRDRWI